jgi:hypothetical protein
MTRHYGIEHFSASDQFLIDFSFHHLTLVVEKSLRILSSKGSLTLGEKILF